MFDDDNAVIVIGFFVEWKWYDFQVLAPHLQVIICSSHVFNGNFAPGVPPKPIKSILPDDVMVEQICWK